MTDAIAKGTVEELLHRFTPKVGDCILIPAGTVHSIGAGVLLAEIQQSSDATFRIFDWNRTGPDGKPRPLHVQESLEAIDYSTGPIEPLETDARPIEGGATREQLARCDYFAIDRLTMTGEASVGCARRERFTVLMVLDGAGELKSTVGKVAIQKGQTFLLPASLGACTVWPNPSSGQLNILTCVVP